MKFYGKGIVWNPDTNKPLMKFVDGKYETEDEYIIKKLKPNYKHDGVDFGDKVLDVEYEVVTDVVVDDEPKEAETPKPEPIPAPHKKAAPRKKVKR